MKKSFQNWQQAGMEPVDRNHIAENVNLYWGNYTNPIQYEPSRIFSPFVGANVGASHQFDFSGRAVNPNPADRRPKKHQLLDFHTTNKMKNSIENLLKNRCHPTETATQTEPSPSLLIGRSDAVSINNNPRSTINQQRLPIAEPVQQQQQQQQNPVPQQQNTNRIDDGIPRIGNPNQCRICGLDFQRPSNLRQHQRERHGPTADGLRCTICDHVTKRKFNMSEHMRLMHPVGGVKDRPFECSFCSKTFTRKSNMNSHIRKTHLK